LKFSGGVGNYTLDFSGELQRDATVTVDSGLGNLSLIIPEHLNATVTMESAAVNISYGSGWTQNGQKYAQKGSGSSLTILIKMAAAKLVITH